MKIKNAGRALTFHFCLQALVMSSAALPPFWVNNAHAREADHLKSIIAVTYDELHIAEALARKREFKDTELNYRVVEIKSELLKLVKDKETKKYLEVSVKNRLKVHKDTFFKETANIYNTLRKFGLQTISRNKKMPELNGRIHLIIGHYDIVFEKNQGETVFHLKSAIALSPKDSEVYQTAYTTLAEFYYINKKYKESLEVYKKVLTYTGEKFWTKHAFNAAWCYFQLHEYNLGTKLMKSVVLNSKNPKYTDYSAFALRDLQAFFLNSQEVNPGIEFIRQESKNNPTFLISFAKILYSKNMLTPADQSLAYAHQMPMNEITNNGHPDVYFMTIFYELKLASRFIKLAEDIKGQFKQFNAADAETYKNNLQNYLFDTQTYIKNKKYNPDDKLILQNVYFIHQLIALLIIADDKNKLKYIYAQGELYFYENKLVLAFEHYQKSLMLIKDRKTKKEDREEAKKILSSMLSILALPNFETSKDNYVKTYIAYLDVSPADEQARAIYPKLFVLFFQETQYPKAQAVIFQFEKHFPSNNPANVKEQQKMVSNIIEIHRKQKNIEELKKWIGLLSAGRFKFPAPYVKQLYSTLGTFLFERTTLLMSKGKDDEALKDFISYSQNQHFSQEVVSNSKYNVSLLYFKKQENDLGVQWILAWFQSAQNRPFGKEKEKGGENLVNIDKLVQTANLLIFKRDFANALKISQFLFQNQCSVAFKDKVDLFIKTISIAYAQMSMTLTSNWLKTWGKCGIPQDSVLMLTKRLIDDASSPLKLDDFFILIRNLPIESLEINTLVADRLLLFNQYALEKNDESLSKRLEDEMQKVHNSEVQRKKLQGIAIAKAQSGLIADLAKRPYTFPDTVFQQVLQAKINFLQNSTEKILGTIQRGEPISALMSYDNLINLYKNFIAELSSFVPPIADPVEQKQFQQGVQSITGPLQQKIHQWDQEVKNLVEYNLYYPKLNASVQTHLPPEQRSLFHSVHEGIMQSNGGPLLQN